MSDVFRVDHTMLSAEKSAQVIKLKQAANIFLDTILHHAPECRETSLAVTKLEESVMWVVKGITQPAIEATKPTN